MTGGMATLILGWLCAFHDPVEGGEGVLSVLRNGTFAIMEGSGSEDFAAPQTHGETLRILAFSAFASHLVSVASTILVTLLAYRAATQWLRASENPDDVNLTPIQYGLLVRTLGSGSLMSIINSLRYARRSRRAKAPQFFKEALAGVTVIYLLSHVVGLVDLWLHSSARSVSVVRSIPITMDARYGITYNEARCGSFNKTELPCQKLLYSWQGSLLWAQNEQRMHLQAYDTIQGINPYVRLEFVNSTAILVPGPVKNFKSRGFTFHTYGLRAQCANLRDQCQTLATPGAQFVVPGGSPVTNCAKAGYPRIPYYTSGHLEASGFDTRNIKSFVLGIIGDDMGGMFNGTGDFSSGWTSNPASTVVQLRWSNVTAHDATDTPGVGYLNALDLYAKCSLTFLDVTARYESIEAKWSIVDTNLSSPELASVFWTPLLSRIQAIPEQLLHTIRPYMTSRAAQAMQVLEMSLARINMGYVSSLITFIPADNITTTRLVTLGLYPTAPILLLVGCLYIYSLAPLLIFVLACTSNHRIIFVPRHLTRRGEKDEERSALAVAQAWLTDPLPLIGSLFPGGDGRAIMRSAEADPLRQVYDSDWGLGKVGIGMFKGSSGERIFGL
ncbi:hypothetical protein M407DRAFT_25693, partial [Tulasnella calospora MUT 4182]